MSETQATATSQDGSNPREQETTPKLLHQASKLLVIGALFPFYTGVQYASQAAFPVGDKTQAFDWTTLIVAKVLVLLGGWIALECAKVRGGTKDKSPLAGLANANAMAGPLVALMLFIAAGAYVFSTPGVEVMRVSKDIGEVYKLGAIAEVGVLALGIYTLAHIVGYIGGGKFNPIFPLMFLGPAIAGVLNLVASIKVFGNPHVGIGVLGLIGSVIVGGAGCYAMFVMWKSIQEAQAHGKQLQEEKRLARKAEREAAKAKREAEKAAE